MVIGVSAAVALWFLFPESSSATALFEVRQQQDSIMHDATIRSTQDFEILRKTQLALLQSKYVLTSALRDPGIASLSILAGARDKEEWLQDHLDVQFPQNGEILSISLSGTPPEDLALLVECRCCGIQEGSSRPRNLKKAIHQRYVGNAAWETSTRKSNANMRITLISRRVWGGPKGPTQRDPETDLLLRDIADTQTKAEALTSGLYQLQTDYMIAKSQLTSPALFDVQAEEALKQDQKYPVFAATI